MRKLAKFYLLLLSFWAGTLLLIAVLGLRKGCYLGTARIQLAHRTQIVRAPKALEPSNKGNSRSEGGQIFWWDQESDIWTE